jgi:hypothetical protein
MAIDFSTNTDEWWRESFERYITGGGGFGITASMGWEAIERHYKACLPAEFTDKELIDTGSEWIIRGTHPRGGAFRLTIQKGDRSWVFGWD